MRPTRLAPLAAIGVLFACQATETEDQMRARMQAESDSARAAIEAAAAAFSQHFNAGHADSAGAFYAPNAVLMPAGAPAVTGRDSIVAALQGFFGMMPPGASFALEVQRVTANGPMAVDRGAWTMTTPTPDGEPMVARGKYLVHWRRIDGRWLMVENIWNDDAPPMTP